jgi:hypothetical protein
MVVHESLRSDGWSRFWRSFRVQHGAEVPAYIAGLIGPGDGKSVQPMAARTGEAGAFLVIDGNALPSLQ